LDSSLPIEKLLVVSPHLDDAVFSCGELIARNAGTLVVTVFSGAPPGFDQLTDWDAASGFLSAEEAVSRRKQEDYAALHLLSAFPLWLDFFDNQYHASPAVSVVSAKLQEVIQDQKPDTILFPAGLFHSDHLLVHQAMLTVRENMPDKHWGLYEDAMYRRIAGALQRRLAGLLEAGIEATPMAGEDPTMEHMKQQAVQCYSSQLQALSRTTPEGGADALAAERVWRLTPMPDTLKQGNAHG
jgi:LmbE family N-acetylglucosaminyl deacetylase